MDLGTQIFEVTWAEIKGWGVPEHLITFVALGLMIEATKNDPVRFKIACDGLERMVVAIAKAAAATHAAKE